MIFNIAHFCALSNPFPKIFRIFFVPAPGRPRIGKSNAAYRFEENTGLFSDRYHIKYTRFRPLSSRNHEKSRKIHEKSQKKSCTHGRHPAERSFTSLQTRSRAYESAVQTKNPPSEVKGAHAHRSTVVVPGGARQSQGARARIGARETCMRFYVVVSVIFHARERLFRVWETSPTTRLTRKCETIELVFTFFCRGTRQACNYFTKRV